MSGTQMHYVIFAAKNQKNAEDSRSWFCAVVVFRFDPFLANSWTFRTKKTSFSAQEAIATIVHSCSAGICVCTIRCSIVWTMAEPSHRCHFLLIAFNSELGRRRKRVQLNRFPRVHRKFPSKSQTRAWIHSSFSFNRWFCFDPTIRDRFYFLFLRFGCCESAGQEEDRKNLG